MQVHGGYTGSYGQDNNPDVDEEIGPLPWPRVLSLHLEGFDPIVIRGFDPDAMPKKNLRESLLVIAEQLQDEGFNFAYEFNSKKYFRGIELRELSKSLSITSS